MVDDCANYSARCNVETWGSAEEIGMAGSAPMTVRETNSARHSRRGTACKNNSRFKKIRINSRTSKLWYYIAEVSSLRVGANEELTFTF